MSARPSQVKAGKISFLRGEEVARLAAIADEEDGSWNDSQSRSRSINNNSKNDYANNNNEKKSIADSSSFPASVIVASRRKKVENNEFLLQRQQHQEQEQQQQRQRQQQFSQLQQNQGRNNSDTIVVESPRKVAPLQRWNTADNDIYDLQSPKSLKNLNRRMMMTSFHESFKSMTSVQSGLSDDTDSEMENLDEDEETAEDRRKRESLVEKIRHLSDHLPERVVTYLMDELVRQQEDDNEGDDNNSVNSASSNYSRTTMTSRMSLNSCGSAASIKSFATSNSHRSQKSNATAASFVSTSSRQITEKAVEATPLGARRRMSLGLNMIRSVASNTLTTERATPAATKSATAVTTSTTSTGGGGGLGGKRIMRTLPGREAKEQRGSLRQSKSNMEKKRGITRQNSMTKKGVARQSSFGIFAGRDDNDNKRNAIAQGYRKQRRRMKTLTAMRKLAGELSPLSSPRKNSGPNVAEVNADGSSDCGSSTGGSSTGTSGSRPRLLTKQKTKKQLTSSTVNPLLPPAERHDGTMLFVDISGFTKLSVELKVEQLSKTINSYFNMIVEEVQAFGGDVIKFAGDALFAEWQCSPSRSFYDADNNNNISNKNRGAKFEETQSRPSWTGMTHERAALTAAACACQIISRCANYKVFGNDEDSNSKKKNVIGREDNRAPIATLNVHCAIAIGEIVGVHVGSSRDKMEYLILGDPIRQLTNAINVGKMGEVVASPEVFDLINENDNNGGTATKTKEPQVILSKTNTFSNRKLLFVRRKRRTGTNFVEDQFFKSDSGWTLLKLESLYQQMSLYVHPVVVNGGGGVSTFSRKENFGTKKFQSEAEIRPVFTIFIQPIMDSEITYGKTIDVRGLILLNEIMVLVSRELTRFKGQLRQFIIDDKGVVLIANFGLRGSTFPKMVERLAMPFAASIQPLLQSELGIDTKMGATFGKVYCGVVGGVARHEYAVLGPSVNLAARLMANPSNDGFLVDEECKQKAGSHPFKALPPVKAKGYVNPVPIFEPMIHHRRSWKDVSANFVGREDELKEISKLAADVIDSGQACKMIIVSAESGYGKSTLLAHATEEIQKSCDIRSATHIMVCQITYEDDFFRPLSVIGPLFVDILAISQRNEGDEDIEPSIDSTDNLFHFINDLSSKPAARRSLFQLVGICRKVDVPDDYIETICCLVINHAWPEKVAGQESDLNELSRYIVRVILHCTLDFDLIIMAIDDIIHTDELSWKIIQLLFQHACNMLIVGTTIPVRGEEMNVDKTFWDELFYNDNFVFMDLPPLDHGDVDRLVSQFLKKSGLDGEKRVLRKSLSARSVFAQSGGMPSLAIDILEGKSHDSFERRSSGVRPGLSRGAKSCHISEAMLHRMDGLSATERTHLNLGAIFGSSFDSFDVILVMERYRGIDDKKKILHHAETVHRSLQEAVENGILETCSGSSLDESIHSLGGSTLALNHPYAVKNVTYRFSHEDWRKNLLTLTLDDWKRDMNRLISEVMESLLEHDKANHKLIVKKLFSHWKETSGDPRDAVALALRIGKTLERNRRGKASLEIYKKAMKLLKGKEKTNTNSIELSDIKLLVELHVTTGRIALKLLDLKTAITEFQAASNLVNESPNVKNRSIIFPAYCGLFCVLRLAGKRDIQFEEVLAETFVTEASEQSESVHILRSLAMHAEVLGRHGKFRDAVSRCRELREVYSTMNDSRRLSEFYEDDHCAQCIGQSALWLVRVFSTSEALEVCNEVTSKILPNISPSDSVGIFITVYPILWVLKDNGLSDRANETFQSMVVDAVKGQNPFHILYTPILMLFDLITTKGRTERCNDYVKWIVEKSNGKHDSQMNIYTGNLGRTADSITAEICLLLASNPAALGPKRIILVKKGYVLAQKSLTTLLKSNSSSVRNIHNIVAQIGDGDLDNKEGGNTQQKGIKSKISAFSKSDMGAVNDPFTQVRAEADLAVKGMTTAYHQLKPVYNGLEKLMNEI